MHCKVVRRWYRVRPGTAAQGHAGRLHFADHIPGANLWLRHLRDSGFSAVTEGTLYPLLLRLERKGLIAAEYRAGSGGPSRKYYRLTPDGVQYLSEFAAAWQEASDTVNRILHDKEG